MTRSPAPTLPPLGTDRAARLIPARRRKEGLVYIEGEKLVHEALAGDWTPHLLILEDSFAATPRGRELSAAAGALGVEAVCATRRVLGRLTSCDTAPPAGLILSPPDLSFSAEEPLPPRLLVLDRISDPGNAGALVRSAVAFGFVPLLTLGGVRPTNEKLLRSTAGLCFRRGTIHSGGEASALAAEFLRNGVQTVLLDPHAPQFLEDFTPRPGRPLALVLGNESTGVDRAVWRDATALRIRTSHLVESLNVAMAGTIALHHFRLSGGGVNP